MISFVALDYFSFSVHAVLSLAAVVCLVKMLPGWWKRRGEKCKIFSLLPMTALNVALLVVYDLCVFRQLTGHLISLLGLAFMPVLLSCLCSCDGKVSMWSSLSVTLTSVILFIFRGYGFCLVGRAGLWILPVIAALAALGEIAWSVVSSTSDVTQLMMSSSVLGALESKVNGIYFLFYLVFLAIGALIGPEAGWVTSVLTFLVALLMTALVGCACWRLMTRKVFCLLRGREAKITEEMRASTSGIPKENDGSESTFMMLFQRLQSYFDEEKPFLDPSLNLSDVARKLFTNKVYLSKAISKFTGRNFCQYVNFHRIRYAVNLFAEDTSLKVTEMAEKSGFRTVNSFNMAFRLYMNMPPGEWCRRNKREKITPLK